jgi:hypothetical protein
VLKEREREAALPFNAIAGETTEGTEVISFLYKAPKFFSTVT